MDNNNKKSISYRLGQLFGAAIIVCATAIIIAITWRLMGWILV